MSEVTVFNSGTQFIQELPTGQQFRLSSLDKYNDLSGDQQLWLSNYLDSNLQKTLTCTITGVSVKVIDRWLKQDKNFQHVKEQLENIYTEGLASLDLMEGFTNQKVRSRVLTARKAKGYEKEKSQNTTNNLIVGGKQGLSGLLQSLNQSQDKADSSE